MYRYNRVNICCLHPEYYVKCLRLFRRSAQRRSNIPSSTVALMPFSIALYLFEAIYRMFLTYTPTASSIDGTLKFHQSSNASLLTTAGFILFRIAAQVSTNMRLCMRASSFLPICKYSRRRQKRCLCTPQAPSLRS